MVVAVQQRPTAPPEDPSRPAWAPPVVPRRGELKLWDVNDRGQLRYHFHPGQARAWLSPKRFIFMLAGTQAGKAVPLTTVIPTPDGPRTMADLKRGDIVFDDRGAPCRVTYTSPVQYGRACYLLTFDDGSTVIADAEHQWVTSTRNQRRHGHRYQSPPPTSIVTTTQIAATLRGTNGHANHSIALTGSVQHESGLLPIPPYVLGVWLGDGTTSNATITTADPEILDHIRAEGIRVGQPKDTNSGKASGYLLGGRPTAGGSIQQRRATIQGQLNLLGVLGNKHIPHRYMNAAPHQRLALLQGLMDTDGGFERYCSFSSVLKPLAQQVLTLACSLGIKARIAPKNGRYNGKPHLSWRVTFSTTLPVFRLSRKAKNLPTSIRADALARFITKVEPVESQPVRCITVDSPTSQYLITNRYIPTHNTSYGPLWLHREITNRGPGDYMSVTSTFPLLKLKMLPEFLRLFQQTLELGEWRSGDRVFEYYPDQMRQLWGTSSTPTRVIFGSASNPDSLESATAKGAWCDEIGQDRFRFNSWQAIVRRLSLAQGRALAGTTIYNLGWLKQEIFDAAMQRGETDIAIIQFASVLNPSFPPEEFESQRRKLPDWLFRMFYLGQFSRPPGLIYGDFIDEYRERGGHKVRPFPIPPEWPHHGGIDPGGVNTAKVYAAHDPQSNVYYIYKATLSGNKTTNEHATELVDDHKGVNRRQWWLGAASENQIRMDYTAAKPVGFTVLEPTITDVEAGINRVIELFKTNRLYIFDDCKLLLDELGTYQRALDTDGRPTDAIADKAQFHILDGCRYLCAGLASQARGVLLG